MPNLTFQDLDRELRGKTLRPAYLIYGSESYLVTTALERIKEHLKVLAGDGFEPDRFSGKTVSPSEIAACAETIPMWVKHRLIIVDNAEGIKAPEAFEPYFKRPSKTSTLVFIAEKADKRTKFFKIFQDKCATVECKPLYDNQVPGWLRMEASRMGRTISQDAANLVGELVGVNLGELHSALEKLMLYIGAKKTIDVDDVETVLTETSRKNIFSFTDAVGEKNISLAIHGLERLYAFNESELMILNMLVRHWRILIKAKEAALKGGWDKNALVSVLNVSPYIVDKYIAQTKLFTPRELKEGFKKLYLTDKMLKSSKLSKREILKKCVRELIVR